MYMMKFERAGFLNMQILANTSSTSTEAKTLLQAVSLLFIASEQVPLGKKKGKLIQKGAQPLQA